MKKNIFLIIVLAMVSACARNDSAPVAYEYASDTTIIGCDNDTVTAPTQSVIRYSAPNDSDLVLETAHHVIQIEGARNQPYKYYVWAGGKDYADDPDLIVEEGTAAVLVTE